MNVDEARAAALAAVKAFSEKKPITNQGKVVDSACAAGRVGRLILLSEKITQDTPQQTKAIAATRVKLERNAVELQKAAVAALKTYAQLCKENDVQPTGIDMKKCQCGYCMGSNAGSIDLLWMAESIFRHAVMKMLITENGVPDFTRISAVESAYNDYARYAAIFKHTLDMENVFYNEW